MTAEARDFKTFNQNADNAKKILTDVLRRTVQVRNGTFKMS
jgi:hypothetical protein